MIAMSSAVTSWKCRCTSGRDASIAGHLAKAIHVLQIREIEG